MEDHQYRGVMSLLCYLISGVFVTGYGVMTVLTSGESNTLPTLYWWLGVVFLLGGMDIGAGSPVTGFIHRLLVRWNRYVDGLRPKHRIAVSVMAIVLGLIMVLWWVYTIITGVGY